MRNTNTEGYRQPEGYSEHLRSRLLDQAAIDSGQEGFAVPSDYPSELRARILSQTVGEVKKGRVISMRLAVAAAVILPLVVVGVLWQSSLTTVGSVQGLAEIPESEMYDYLAMDVDDVAVDDLIQYELIDDLTLQDLSSTTDDDIESYLEAHLDDLDLDALDDYL